MRLLIAGVSAIALVSFAGCKEEAADSSSSSASSSSSPAAVAQLLKDYKAKDYGQTDSVLAAMNLVEGGPGPISFDAVNTKGGVTTLDNFVFTMDVDGDVDEVKLGADKLVLEGLQTTDEGSSFDRLTLSGIKLLDAPQGVTLGLGEIQVFEPNDKTAAFISRLVAGESIESYPSFESMAFGRLSFSNLTINADGTQMEDPEEGKVAWTIENLSIESLADAFAGGINLGGFDMSFDIPQDEVDAPFPVSGHVKLDQMNFGGVRAGFLDDVTKAVASSEEDEEAAVAELMNSLNARNAELSPIDQGYDMALINGFDMDVAGLSMTIDNAETKVVRNDDGVATRVISPQSVINVNFDSAGGLGAMAAEQLSKLGYDSLTLRSGGDATYDPETDQTRYEDFTLAVDDMLSLRFDGGFNNLSDFKQAMAQAQADGGQPDMSLLQSLSIADFSLTLEDKSILDRGFAMAAEMQGMEPGQLRAMATGMLAMATMSAGQSGLDPELVSETVTALSAFIQEGGALTLSMNPETPVSASSFEDPTQITKSSLGWSASHNN